MGRLFIYGIVALFIVTAVGGFYLYLERQTSRLEKVIEDQRAEIAAKEIDNSNLRLSNKSLENLIARQKADLAKAEAQLKKIAEFDSSLNLKVTELETLIRRSDSNLFKTRDSALLEKLNNYQLCRAQNPMGAQKCLSILSSP